LKTHQRLPIRQLAQNNCAGRFVRNCRLAVRRMTLSPRASNTNPLPPTNVKSCWSSPKAS